MHFQQKIRTFEKYSNYNNGNTQNIPKITIIGIENVLIPVFWKAYRNVREI